MRFDRLGGLSSAFDHVRIQRALGQPVDILALCQLLDFFIERINELIANDFPLLFRIRYPLELIQEFLRRINLRQIQLHIPAERFHDALRFPFAKQTMIDEHAVQLRSDRLVQQRRYNRGIHPAG